MIDKDTLCKVWQNKKTVNHMENIPPEQLQGIISFNGDQLPIMFNQPTLAAKQFIENEQDKLKEYMQQSSVWVDICKIKQTYNDICDVQQHFKLFTLDEYRKFVLRIYQYLNSYCYINYYEQLTDEIFFQQKFKSDYIDKATLNKFMHMLFLAYTQPYLEVVYNLFDQLNLRVISKNYIICKLRPRLRSYCFLNVNYHQYDVQYSINEKQSYLVNLFANMFLSTEELKKELVEDGRYKTLIQKVKEHIEFAQLKTYIKETIQGGDEVIDAVYEFFKQFVY